MKRWGWLFLLLPMGLGLINLRFDVDVLNLLPAELPVVEGLKLQQRHLATGDELIVTVHADDAETAETATRSLAVGLRSRTNLVSRVLWQPPWIEHPDQISELVAFAWLNELPEGLAQLTNRLAPENISGVLESARRTLATSLSPDDIGQLGYDPLGFSRLPHSGAADPEEFGQGEEFFVSADGTFRLIFLKPATVLGSYRDNTSWLEILTASVDETRRAQGVPDSVKVSYTGAPAFIAETATGMRRDLSGSAGGTLAVVAVLFWWAHRRWLPLLWLVVLLNLILVGTLALGGLVFGVLNIVSLGFAAILLGLAEDYAVILYQEAVDHPRAKAAEVARQTRGAILWSALTTAGAYLLLNFAGLPGLGQLGTLVALGILLAAVVMLFGFLPVALAGRAIPSASNVEETVSGDSVGVERSTKHHSLLATFRLPWLATGFLLLAGTLILGIRFPSIDHTADALSPTGSPAYRAMEEINRRMGVMDKALWLLVSGCDEWEVARRMEALEDLARTSDGRPWIKSVTFPTTFWPNAERRRANLVALTNISNRRESVRHAVLAAGFSDDAFELAERVFSTWERVSASSEASWPTNEANRWILEKVSARTPTGWLALGIVEPATNPAAAYAGAMASLGKEISRNGARLTGWTALGEGLLEHAERRLPWVVGAMIALLALCLWLAFGNAREMLLSFATLALAFLCLLALMSLVGWSWNLMNLMAAPLLMGVGVDYTIHTQLALRRYRGNAVRFRRTTGRALLLCSATTIAGFGSLAWAGNAGLASLGKLCATGIACVLVLSLFLLPAWWRALQASNNESPTQPSSLYRTEVWRFGLIAGRLLPRRAADYLSRLLGLCYYRLQPRRGEIVARNLLPVLNGDRLAAKRAARSLFKEFAMKIADLWRFESGVAVEEWLNEWTGLEHLSAAHSRGRGVLLVTPHLGNWELGGAFMRKHGIQLLVLTQSEPEPRLTKIRQKARARWGIETVVVGTDPFAFVEIIKRLQEGAVVALLVDRPPPETAVDVELFGQPFRASNAAADLARASGSAILPVYVVREGKGYNAHILPEVVYDRAAISDRAARTRLTQEILRAFEPVIRQHHTQWYHFVPIWPDKNAG